VSGKRNDGERSLWARAHHFALNRRTRCRSTARIELDARCSTRQRHSEASTGEGGGPRTRECETLLEVELEVPRVLPTTSCTPALELVALLLDLSPGDEVIVPSFTFVSTANAFALRGARIIFCDIRPDTLALDEQQLGALLSSRTKAIVPVHYAGIACEMDAIQRVAQAHGDVAVVEDNAHGLYGKYRGDYLPGPHCQRA
jgi:dTDP-4-amino-4,6-dideoxygalactose transaminase